MTMASMAKRFMTRRGDGPVAPRRLAAAALTAALILPLAGLGEAQAVMRGEPARDPNGTRRSTVLIETPEGICTGAIVGPDLVLTAAHCVSARGRYRVRYLDRSFRRQNVAVTRTAAHPGFDPNHGFASDDVGLIQVARPFGSDIGRPGCPRAPGASAGLAAARARNCSSPASAPPSAPAPATACCARR